MSIFNKEEITFIRKHSHELGQIIGIMAGETDDYIKKNYKKISKKELKIFSNKIIDYFITD